MALGRAFWRILLCLGFVPPIRAVYKILGENIRVQRVKIGFSQEQLAEKAQLSRNYIGNIERAEHKVTVEALARIAKALKVTIHDLTRGI